MSYQQLPDPRPLAVKYALGRMSRGTATTLMFGFGGLCVVGLIGLCINYEHGIVWGAVAIAGAVLAAQYSIAIRWVDFHKTWPRRRSYHKHRMTQGPPISRRSDFQP